MPAPSPAATGEEGEAGLIAAAPCQVCGGAAVLPHMNCANIDCNKLFIACPACKVTVCVCVFGAVWERRVARSQRGGQSVARRREGTSLLRGIREM